MLLSPNGCVFLQPRKQVGGETTEGIGMSMHNYILALSSCSQSRNVHVSACKSLPSSLSLNYDSLNSEKMEAMHCANQLQLLKTHEHSMKCAPKEF